jgi:hypothetical protein
MSLYSSLPSPLSFYHLKVRKFLSSISIPMTAVSVSILFYLASGYEKEGFAAILGAFLANHLYLKNYRSFKYLMALTYVALAAVNASSFLRTSQILFGLYFIATHPWGIGFSDHPLAAAIKTAFPEIKSNTPPFDVFHSALINFGIQYEIEGLIFMGIIVLTSTSIVVRRFKVSARQNMIPLLLYILCIWIFRVVFDTIGDTGLFLFSALCFGVTLGGAYAPASKTTQRML